MMLPRLVLAVLMLTALPFTAAAQAGLCASTANDQAKLDCDIARADTIASAGTRLFGAPPGNWLRIVDTESSSGLAYVYYVTEEAPYQLLEARSVPLEGAAGNAPACQLRTTLPLDVSQKVKQATAEIRTAPPAATGPRESITLNPDGSRSIRLILDSHDIITRLRAGEDVLHFSRLAAVEDAITQLNNLVIGVANFSGDWSCDAV